MRTGTLQPGPRCSGTSRHRAARVVPAAVLTRQRAAAAVQITGFAGFRQAGVVDALGSRPAAATLQAAVQRSLGAPRSRGARLVTHAMFERFTEKAIKVVMLAQEEARRLGERRATLSRPGQPCSETSSPLERSCSPCFVVQTCITTHLRRSAWLPPTPPELPPWPGTLVM